MHTLLPHGVIRKPKRFFRERVLLNQVNSLGDTGARSLALLDCPLRRSLVIREAFGRNGQLARLLLNPTRVSVFQPVQGHEQIVLGHLR